LNPMSETPDSKKIILASASPRRKRLLEKAGVDIRVIPSRIDETAVCAATPETYVRVLAHAKADDISRSYPDSWVIGADSIVAIDDKILNKPESRTDARRMLDLLSGRTHRVLTGYSVICRECDHLHTDVAITEVTFKRLSPGEIEWYLDTPEPYDKAGSYAIQGIGAFMVLRINGSYTNVVGLPLSEVVDHLIAQGVIRRDGDEEPQRTAGGNTSDGCA